MSPFIDFYPSLFCFFLSFLFHRLLFLVLVCVFVWGGSFFCCFSFVCLLACFFCLFVFCFLFLPRLLFSVLRAAEWQAVNYYYASS